MRRTSWYAPEVSRISANTVASGGTSRAGWQSARGISRIPAIPGTWPSASAKSASTSQKAKKLSFKEKQEFDGMEAAITAAEAVVTAREADVQAASNAGHQALTEACKQLEDAQKAVETLYARWQELEAKTSGG